MQTNIGKIISKTLKERSISKTEFATQMNYSKQNINNLLAKDNWQVKQIWDASLVLEINLFKSFLIECDYTLNKSKSKLFLNKDKNEAMKLENEFLKQELSYLKKILELI